MTGFADIRCINMVTGFIASMAARTSPKHLVVIHGRDRGPAAGRMACIADISTGNV